MNKRCRSRWQVVSAASRHWEFAGCTQIRSKMHPQSKVVISGEPPELPNQVRIEVVCALLLAGAWARLPHDRRRPWKKDGRVS